MSNENNLHKTLTCPLCGSKNVFITNTFSIEHLLNHLDIGKNGKTAEELKQLTYNIWKVEKSYYYKCEYCSFTFAKPFAAGDSKFYNLIYQKEINYAENKWEYDVAKKIIAKHKPFSLLELGAGNGNFLKKISPELIAKENIYSTEFSDYGKKCIIENGFNCYTESIDFFTNDSKFQSFFDVICFFQFLEHIDNINHFLQQLNKITSQKALIIVAVPNDIRRNIFENLNIFEDIPPIHISKWNKKSFEFWATKNNWKLIEHVYEPTNYKEIIYYYLNNKTALFQKINKIKFSFFKKIAKSIIILFLLIFYFRGIIKILKKNLGISQLAYFEKIQL